MSRVVTVTGPRTIVVADEPDPPLRPGELRVETWYSGVSAGTELTAYRGSNPYLTKTWDPGQRLFADGATTFDYPLVGWGYEEVGRVVELGKGVDEPSADDVVYGAWGHRSRAVLSANAVRKQVLPHTLPPVHAVFARVGAVALNAVLASDIHVGEHIAVFGQGVIGLLVTRLATLNGGAVTAVDLLPQRLDLARRFGAANAVPADQAGGAAVAIRDLTEGTGADVAIEISGNYRALHEAIRSVTAGGRVVAAGFYQGEGAGLRLGEEFHHNQVELIASQIGAVPPAVSRRWDRARLTHVFVRLVDAKTVDVAPLLTHVVDVTEVADVFQMLDERPGEALQVVLRFPGAPEVTS
jgi:2-desacetyl-2-hydroxyethyl bacteriochlorophyllide A dehydrogenase